MGEGKRNIASRLLNPLFSPSMIVYGGLVVILLSDLLNATFIKGIS